jgi:hypothetical protein
MAEQSLRERLYSTHHVADSGRPRGMLIAGAAVGVVAAVLLAIGFGAPWGGIGIALTGACTWGLFARRTRAA